MKNTVPGKGYRGRKRNKGGVGKDMGWERRERQSEGKGQKGTGNSVGSEDLARTTIRSEHAGPLDGAVQLASSESNPDSEQNPPFPLVPFSMC